MDIDLPALFEWRTWLSLELLAIVLLALHFQSPQSERKALISRFFAYRYRHRAIFVLWLLSSLCLPGLGVSLILVPSTVLNFIGGILTIFGFQLARAVIDWSRNGIGSNNTFQ